MKNRYIVGVLGAGNMGEALIKGLLRSQLVRSYEIIASARRTKRLKLLETTYGIHTTPDNVSLVESAHTLILGIKPQDMKAVAAEIAKKLTADHVVISIAAGVDLAKLKTLFGNKAKLVRVMPNLPALIDAGVSAICCAKEMPERDRRFAHQIFQAVGQTIDIRNEKLMDVITALSGTGPAYFFAMMEAMRDAAEKLGLDPKLALRMTVQTALGAAAIAAQDGADPEKLRERVTSKKGTTWAAMKVFENRQFWKTIEEAMKAAVQRSKELRSTKE